MKRPRGEAVARQLETLFNVGGVAALTDGQLLEQFTMRHGEAAELAFAALVERHGPMVLRTCRSILRDDHEAHDAFQATFLVLIRKGSSLWLQDSLGPWLHRVACRAAVRAKVRANRRKSIHLAVAQRRDSEAIDGQRDARFTALHEEIERLPPLYRIPIVLCALQGRSYEEAARHLGWPIGTVKSRLARGRERLRRRLVRRGVTAAVGSLGVALDREAAARAVPVALADSTVRLGFDYATSVAPAGSVVPRAIALANAVSRRSLMVKFTSVAAAFVASLGLVLIGGLASRSPAESPPRPVPLVLDKQGQLDCVRCHAAQPHNVSGIMERGLRPGHPAILDEKSDPHQFEARHKDSLLAQVGNMRPLIKTEHGVSFQSREAILYKDGSAKLWLWDSKAPIAPSLRHETPIRELGFADDANLLFTTADDDVKVWDALTGHLRKRIPGQVMRPLFFSDLAGRKQFVTIDPAGRVVTTWDVSTLEPTGSFRPGGSARLLGAGVSKNGKSLVTLSDDRTVSLWNPAETLPFATLRAPAPVVGRAFVDEIKWSKDPTVQLDARFWEMVGPLLP